MTEEARTWARLACSPRGGWRGAPGVLWGPMLSRCWTREGTALRAESQEGWKQESQMTVWLVDTGSQRGSGEQLRGSGGLGEGRRRPPHGWRVWDLGTCGVWVRLASATPGLSKQEHSDAVQWVRSAGREQGWGKRRAQGFIFSGDRIHTT